MPLFVFAMYAQMTLKSTICLRQRTVLYACTGLRASLRIYPVSLMRGQYNAMHQCFGSVKAIRALSLSHILHDRNMITVAFTHMTVMAFYDYGMLLLQSYGDSQR